MVRPLALELEHARRPGTAQVAVDQQHRCPALAIAIATLTAVVDLPSPGTELVTTNALLRWSTSMKDRLVRSTRNASARGAWAGSQLISGSFRTSGVVGEGGEHWGLAQRRHVVDALHRGVQGLAQHGKAETEDQAQHQPQREVAELVGGRPAHSGMPGDVDDGRLEKWDTCWPGGVSSSATKPCSCRTTPWLIRWASRGLGSVTVILRTTVSGTTEAWIFARQRPWPTSSGRGSR